MKKTAIFTEQNQDGQKTLPIPTLTVATESFFEKMAEILDVDNSLLVED